MKEGKTYFVLFNHIPELSAAIEKTVNRAVRKAAFDIQALAQTSAPVRLGFLKSSIYTVTKGESTYSSASAEATAANPNATMLPEVEQPVSGDEAYVAVGAEYGIYVEYGTSHMAAQPYLTPAYEMVIPSFVEALSRLEERLKGVQFFNSSELTEE